MDRIIIFGAGNNYYEHRKQYESQYEILSIVDNRYEELEGIDSPRTILERDYDYVLISPCEWKEIYLQLLDMGVENKKIIIPYEEPFDYKMYEKEILGNHYYGQHAEDLIICSIFARIGIEKPSYIDLGTNHPVADSNTFLLYQNGCRGITVEANPNLKLLINRVRIEDVNLNVGVGKEEGFLRFYMYDNWSAINTFDINRTKEWKEKPTEIEVPVITLNTIVDRYCAGVFPDFLDSDIEGLDYEVLESFNLEENGPKVICVEVRPAEINRFDVMLDSKGYYKFSRIGANCVYVRKEYASIVSYVDL